MRLYSSMILTRIDSQRRQAIRIESMLSALTRSLGSGLPSRSVTVISGWPCWMDRRMSCSVYPPSTPMRMALAVLPRPGPPTRRQRRRTTRFKSGIKTNDE
jgi:hypothetical protein